MEGFEHTSEPKILCLVFNVPTKLPIIEKII